jgi:predicted Zn finger-like uncharacterized protein
MNLATRCLQCGTVFRVAEEQLLSSEGWVRCGRCNGVFNATEVLFDIDTNAPMRLAPVDEPAAAPEAPAQSTALPDDAPFESLLRAPSRADAPVADEPIVITDHVPPTPPSTPAAVADDDEPVLLAEAPAPPASTRREPTPITEPMLATEAARPAEPALAAEPAPAVTASISAAAIAAATPPQATPSFLRQAERGRLLRHPAARAGAVLAVVLLAGAVPLQMALLWRDSLAAHLPASTPTLQALCRLAGCSVQPLRRIHQLAVASSGLNRVDGAPLYRLQLVLQNRADTAVMAPALDLTLTDPQGQLLARRVLPAAELGLAQPALQAGQELPIKLLLSTGERRVAGYTLELFYP